jgi:hypothetical protein
MELNNSKPGRDSAVIPKEQRILVAPAWTLRATPSQSPAAVITASLASIPSSRVIWPTEEAFRQNAAGKKLRSVPFANIFTLQF